VWEAPVGPEIYPELVYEFPVQSKSDFSTTKPLRGYDNCEEDWPKCMNGEDCQVSLEDVGLDAPNVRRKRRRAIKTFSEWIEREPKEK